MKNIIYISAMYIFSAATVPLQCMIAFVIAATSGLPVLFHQIRIGKGGKTFVMYKFRTMRSGADTLQQELTTLNEASGPVFKIHNDPRYTRVGKFLSHTGLDELPQLWNVLCGDMALIGPRPLPVSEAKKLTSWQKKRHTIKPGIISPWILEGYHRQTFEAWMKSDIAYIQHKSLGYDVLLFFRACGLLIRLLYREMGI